jgi:hypothetical protein
LKILFIALAAGGLILFYLEERKKAAQASIAALPISTSNADQLLMQTLLPRIAAGQMVNPDGTPFTDPGTSVPGAIQPYAGN